MAILHNAGNSVTAGEMQLTRFLKNELPEDYHIYYNFEIPSNRGQFTEYDVAVIAPNAIFVIEDKYWHGRIYGNDNNIELSSGEIRKNPFHQATRQAKILKTYLTMKNPKLSNLWVQPVVHFSGDNVVIDIHGNTSAIMHTFETIVDFILKSTIPSNRQYSVDFQKTLFEDCLKEFSIFNTVRDGNKYKEFGRYKIIEKGDEQREYYNEYIVEDPHVGPQTRYLLREYFIDSELSDKNYQKQLKLLKNDFVMLERLHEVYGIVKPKDSFQPAGDQKRFCVVYRTITDAKPLIEWFLEGKAMDVKIVRKLLINCLNILKDVHEYGIIHRNITPENILVTPSDRVFLRNFEFSRMNNTNSELTILTSVLDNALNERYVPIDLYGDYSKATKGSDLYSLGRVFYDLLAGSDQIDWREINGNLPPIKGIKDEKLMNVIIKMSTRFSKNWYYLAEEVLDELGSVEEIKQGPTLLQKGAVIDKKIEIIDRLGQGGMSSVYKVFNQNTGMTFAIKVMKEGPQSLEIAKSEFQKLIELQHPNIVRMHDIDTFDNDQKIILKMEYIEGKSLQQYLDDKVPLTIAQIMKWCNELLSALIYLQEQEKSIVHADIKPGNVLVSKTSKVKLIDFNISRSSEDTSLVGLTEKYCAPDARAIGIDPSLDTYSLGFLVFLLLTGEDKLENGEKLLKTVRSNISDELVEWIMKACAPYKNERFETPIQMAQALDNIIKHFTKKQIVNEETKILSNSILSVVEYIDDYTLPLIPNYQSLYSQSTISNKGTRGLDVFAEANYVQTMLDTELPVKIMNGDSQLIIITGNAGDGKTAFIQKLENTLIQNGAKILEEHSNGKKLEYEGKILITNYDGSQDEDDVSNEEVLHQFFGEFSGNQPFLSNKQEIKLIAINEGRLMEFLMDPNYRGLLRNVERYLRTFEVEDNRLSIINLNWRSVVLKQGELNSIVERLLDKLANIEIVENCDVCTNEIICPTCFNIKTLNDKVVGPQVKEQIRRIFEVVHLRKKFHITMRDIRSALSYIIYGTLSSKEVKRLIRIRSKESLQQLHNLYYYNAIFNVNNVKDRLMQELGQIDISNVIEPNIERSLAIQNCSNQDMYVQKDFNDARKENALLDYFYEFKLKEHIDIQYFNHFIKTSKRKFFFEALNNSNLSLLPYSSYEDYISLFDDKTNLESEKEKLLIAISYMNDIRNPIEGNLCLKDSKSNGWNIVSMRLYPIEHFELVPIKFDEQVTYIESGGDRVRLIYKENKRIALDVTLDIYEMLMKVLKGYIPTLQEIKGPFMNITIFKRQLLSQPYSEIRLINNQEQYIVKQVGEVIKIERGE